MAFPTITYKSILTDYESNEIKSSPQDGKVIARRKFTKTRREFTVQPTKLKDADFLLLKEYYDTVGTVVSFQWINPLYNPDDTNDSSLYTVRFMTPISGTKSATFPNHYDVKSFKLMEV